MSLAYTRLSFQELRIRVAAIPGVPLDAVNGMTAVLFTNRPLPPDLQASLHAVAGAVEVAQGRLGHHGHHAQLRSIFDEVLLLIERETQRTMAAISNSAAERLISPRLAAHLPDSRRRRVGLGACLVQGISLLIEHGLSQDLAAEPNAFAVMGRLLDMSWERPLRTRDEGLLPDEASARDPESLQRQYRRGLEDGLPVLTSTELELLALACTGGGAYNPNLGPPGPIPRVFIPTYA